MMIKWSLSYLEPDQLAKMIAIHICIGETWVALVVCIRNLGFFTDKFLKNAHEVNKLISQLFYTQAGIARICVKLDLESAKTIVLALELSKVDYCNSLLAGSAQYQIDKLQHIENMACRVVYQLKKFDHVTDSMESLHWLKVQECIVFKLATLVYKCKSDMAASHLKDLLHGHSQSCRILRSSA